MKITIFIAMKFRVGYESEIADYVRDSFEVEQGTPLEAIAEIIKKRMDELSLNLNRSIYAQLRSLAS